MTTFERVRAVIAEILGCEEDDVNLESRLIQDLSADSMDVVEICMDLEAEFDITIPDRDGEKLMRATVADIVRYIDERIAQP